ncbi:lysozyme inhibitor LprI family protein [Flammeovirgaceae bacterium SG7u.111]|nr:lysozyme inhibitor LprI family protein [Flammeovirgaceae bacterium SG7u.132]WPO34376.1 lysozyme inhibitor LprI family protein [Flammeovirgaceae bacterium SG7u.111]
MEFRKLFFLLVASAASSLLMISTLAYGQIEQTTLPQVQQVQQTQQVQQHPIDIEIANCYSVKPNTMGILECEIMGYNKWNGEMERLYDQLAARLNEDAKLVLKDQQLAWMKYRDLQFEFFEKIYGDRIPVLAANRTDVIRKRAKELQVHLDAMNSQK